MSSSISISGLFFLILVVTQISCQRSSTDLGGLREDIKELIEVEKANQKELQEIKTILQARQAPTPSEPQNVVLNIDGKPYKGDKNARVTLVEFSDYQCPFCARYVRDTMPQIETDYIKTGKVKYFFSDYPLDFHKNAFRAAEAAHCAGDQGKYWEMHDRLFNNQTQLDDLKPHAKAIGLDMSKFDKCMDSGEYASEVRTDVTAGQKAGVSGTPTFFIGVTNPEGKEVKAVTKIVGARPYSNFKEAIDGLLSSEK